MLPMSTISGAGRRNKISEILTQGIYQYVKRLFHPIRLHIIIIRMRKWDSNTVIFFSMVANMDVILNY